MKRLMYAMLCFLLTGLCACGQTKPPEKDIGTTEYTLLTTNMEKTSEMTTNTVAVKPNPSDPYSYVAVDVLESGGNKPAGWSDGDYTLYDVDSQGKQALLLGWKNSSGQVSEIYTIEDGVAEQKLSIFDKMGQEAIVIWKTGVISTGQSDGVVWYYRFEEGQLKLIAGLGMYANWGDKSGGFRVDPTSGDSDFFFDFIPDGTEIPIGPDEYNAMIDEFLGDREPADLDWKPLAEYGR